MRVLLLAFPLCLAAAFTPATGFSLEDHPYSSVPVKGPCPAMNTLANHGFLPRNGRNVPTKDMVHYGSELFGIDGLDFIVQQWRDTNTTRTISINGLRTEVLDFEELWEQAGDSSLVRLDPYFDPSLEKNEERLAGLEVATGSDAMLTHEKLAAWRDVLIQDSLDSNPEFEVTELAMRKIGRNSAFVFAAFGSDPLFATIPIDTTMSFLRHNRFPDTFVPRPERGEETRNFLKDPLMIALQEFYEESIALTIPLSVEFEHGPNIHDCVGAFRTLQFELTDYDLYSTFFRADSRVVLPQAGIYTGAQEIEEYIRFADDSSPYIDDFDVVFQTTRFKSVDRNKGQCTFLIHSVQRREMNPNLTKEATFLVGQLIQVHYDFHQHYIKEIDLHYETDFIEAFFGDLLHSDETRSFICDVSEACPKTNVGLSHEQCVRKLEELPTISADGTIRGQDYGCRALHAVFASINQDHCPHISFEPQADHQGIIKCQVSSRDELITSEDLFDRKDLNDFLDFLEEDVSHIESITGFKYLERTNETSLSGQIWLGLVVPCLIFLGSFVVVRRKGLHERQCGEGDNVTCIPLFANNGRRLWTLAGVMTLSITLSFGLGVLVVWQVVKAHPDWDSYPDVDNELKDNYRGAQTNILGSAPHESLDFDQFVVYVGFLVWVTCLYSGFGLEVFVWSQFLQTWDEPREAAWRFVQFIFPLMLTTTLGLASQRNFLCFPFLVLGLWKFGFGECLLYSYLGLFSNSPNRLRRLSDLLNGVGTFIHHSAASFIIAMLSVGAISSSRYILNGAFILVVQHWITLLGYANPGLYTGATLVLEWYFQWVVFCKWSHEEEPCLQYGKSANMNDSHSCRCATAEFDELYYLHWSAALGSGVMVFSHWIYLVAGAIDLFNDDEDVEHFSRRLHARGNKVMFSGVMSHEKKFESQTSDST